MLAYTVGDDRQWDARLLRWDVLGSLGHVEGAARLRLLTPSEHTRLRAGLRAALDRGRRRAARASAPAHEDVHTAVEDWLTRRLPGIGERLHTGRSRNDQVATDLRLYLKDQLLLLHAGALDLAEALLDFAVPAPDGAVARLHPSAPGDAVVGRALGAALMPKGLLDTVEALRGALAGGGPLAARQRRGLWRAAAARARGRGAGPRLRGARSQRGHGAERPREARGGGALLVHPAGPRARAGCRRT